MTIPPFPSQDLAKLVLGYLAEEQLMTAYDEFLQASPYLDAFQNEYDRIFMTSLKSILAEYRAVKIYVETCKPILLRKKIFQCTNLLDIIKLLVNHIDLSKLQSQEATEKVIIEKHHITVNKTNTCETCVSLKLANCTCKLGMQQANSQSIQMEASSLQNSIETTPLADLPGNHVTRKKLKVLEKESVFSDGQNSTSSEMGSLSSHVCVEENKSINSTVLKCDNTTVSLSSNVKVIDLVESRKKIEEFDNVLKSVLDKNNTVTASVNTVQRVSNASTFQDFASAVSAGRESQNPNVPDSSTSENLSIQTPLTKDYYKDNVVGSQKRQLLLQVSQRNDNTDIQTCRRDKNPKYTKIRVKPDDQKVKILSDVKVTNKKKTTKIATSTPVTSTPLMQMRTIVINGKSAYSHAPIVTQHAYTKDEIMAMPTLIVVPASGSSKIPTSTQCKPIMSQNCNPSTHASSTESIGPLVIDVPPIPHNIEQPELLTKLPDLDMPGPSEAGRVKTVDFAKNASVPKDSVTFADSKTPQVLPKVRKSSSTPRRTTHVRVLDFATPRRILHETINEQVTSHTTETPVEILVSSSPNVSFVDTTVAENNQVNNNAVVVSSDTVVQKADGCDTDTGSTKENSTTSNLNVSKKSNWDADWRALIANDSAATSANVTKRKKNSKRKKAIDKAGAKEKKRCDSDISPKIKRTSKNHRKVIDDDDDDDNALSDTATTDVPVKPTINIISGCDLVATEAQPVVPQDNNAEMQNKSCDKDDDCVQTPDGDRLSLQNVIGARLNISDLLETPYKQALYDIQMGTPRLLPDLPGEPLSDIKITNIPTPRFLDTPKPVQATPSSWSSRPTDYSSGGSYYKPDDQDYGTIPDLRCAVSSSSKEDMTSDKSVDVVRDDEKKSRPQRQCTKNVSYKFAASTSKVKDDNDVIDAASCSDSTGSERKNKDPVVKTPRDRPRSIKSEAKKKFSSKRKKSPAVKEKTKTFIKIKPRQTPTKLTPIKNKKTIVTPGYISPIKLKRVRTISKNVSSITPLVVAAPMKSRRKSSTPRKLHCTKSFNSHNDVSPETAVITKQNTAQNGIQHTQDSDAEQIVLRWSDDGSQDTNIKQQPTTTSVYECEDISQIQEYIKTSSSNQPPQSDGSFQSDLMKRGFDVETAKILERDLLDIPQPSPDNTGRSQITLQIIPTKIEVKVPVKNKDIDSATNDVQVVHDETEEEEEEVELTVHECNEETENYFAFQYDDTNCRLQEPPIRLKDTFSMNICIDDGVTVRLRATPFSLPFDQDPMSVEEIDYSYNCKETELAVNSICNMERLYTPLKESYKTQCYEIFDSTLTSLDTPLKANSPNREECATTVSEIVSQNQIQIDKGEMKKRKRSCDSNESTSDSKKTKYLLTSESIQNIDIESVLTKLHGP